MNITTWQYIHELFKPDETVAICLRKQGEPIQQRILTAAAACCSHYQRFLRAMNAQGADVWISMNPLQPGAKQRTKKHIAEVRRIFLDLDHDADNTLKLILNDSTLPKPNYILNTSPGKYQLIWNVQGFPPYVAEKYMQGLARFYHADVAVVDISRVLRLPGLHNKKYAKTFRVTAERLSTRIYQIQDFLISPESLHELRAQPAGHTSKQRSATGSDTSRSGQDWGYCCTALWRSHDIETTCSGLIVELTRRAAERNNGNPSRYAHRTVS